MTEKQETANGNVTKHAYDDSIFATSRIDPTPHKTVTNKSLFDRTKYALAGLLYSLRRERSVRNVGYTTAVVLTLSAWVRLGRVQSMIIFVSLGLVWTAELLNSAIEAVVDMVMPRKRHDMAKVAKDVAAAATFVATITSSLTTLILLMPPLLKKLGLIQRDPPTESGT